MQQNCDTMVTRAVGERKEIGTLLPSLMSVHFILMIILLTVMLPKTLGDSPKYFQLNVYQTGHISTCKSPNFLDCAF